MDFNFDTNLSNYLKRGGDLVKRNDIYNALEWAKNNPNYKFITIMENAPSSRLIKFSNDEF